MAHAARQLVAWTLGQQQPAPPAAAASALLALPEEVLQHMVLLEPAIAQRLAVTDVQLAASVRASILHEFEQALRELTGALAAWDGRGTFGSKRHTARLRAVWASMSPDWFLQHVTRFPALTAAEEDELQRLLGAWEQSRPDVPERLLHQMRRLLAPARVGDADAADADAAPVPLMACRSWWSIAVAQKELFAAVRRRTPGAGQAAALDAAYIGLRQGVLFAWGDRACWEATAWLRLISDTHHDTVPHRYYTASTAVVLAHLAHPARGMPVTPTLFTLMEHLDALWWLERGERTPFPGSLKKATMMLIVERFPATRAVDPRSFLYPTLPTQIGALLAKPGVDAAEARALVDLQRAVAVRADDPPTHTLLDMARPFATLSDTVLVSMARLLPVLVAPAPRGDAPATGAWRELFEAVAARLPHTAGLLATVLVRLDYKSVPEARPLLACLPAPYPIDALLNALADITFHPYHVRLLTQVRGPNGALLLHPGGATPGAEPLMDVLMRRASYGNVYAAVAFVQLARDGWTPPPPAAPVAYRMHHRATPAALVRLVTAFFYGGGDVWEPFLETMLTCGPAETTPAAVLRAYVADRHDGALPTAAEQRAAQWLATRAYDDMGAAEWAAVIDAWDAWAGHSDDPR